MEKLYKENQIGKANIFDRYYYFTLALLRAKLMIGCDMIHMEKNPEMLKTHEESLVQYEEITNELLNEIKSMDIKDRKFLFKDSKFAETKYVCDGFMKELYEKGVSLQTEYTQSNPYMSEELIKWFYMDEVE